MAEWQLMMYKLCGRSSSVEHQLPKLDRRVQFPSPAWLLSIALLILWLAGCAATAVRPITKPQEAAGMYHRIQRGQTLWGISRIYNVDLQELARVNHISDAVTIETGQMLFVPGYARKVIPGEVMLEDFCWPLKGKVTAGFGQTVNNTLNKGINIQAQGSANVVAARSGKIIFYSPDFLTFGKTLIIDHGGGFTSVYARNSQVFVRTGDSVEKGRVIAKAGRAGRDKNTYLHFEIRKGYKAENPVFYLPQ